MGVKGAVTSVVADYSNYTGGDLTTYMGTGTDGSVVSSDVRLEQFSEGPGGGGKIDSNFYADQVTHRMDDRPHAAGPSLGERMARSGQTTGNTGMLTGAVTETPKAGEAQLPTAGGPAGGSAAAGAKIEGEMSVNERLQKMTLDQQIKSDAQSQRNHDQTMAMTQQAHTRGMYGLLLQGGGALLQAWGASETAKDEKEWREKGLKWKAPKDPIDVVNPNLRIDKTEVA
jgi:hypothetical protein